MTPSPNILRIYGKAPSTLEDVLDFLLYHEGVHSGYIMALKHWVV